MERAAAHALAAAVEQERGAAEHLAGGAARERQQQDALRRRPRLDEVGHAVDERPRLPRPRARHDQHRPVARRRRGVLLLVERARVVDRQVRRGGELGLFLEDETAGHVGVWRCGRVEVGT